MSSIGFEAETARGCADGIAHVGAELQGVADALARVNVRSFVNGQIAEDYQQSIEEVARVTSDLRQDVSTYARALTSVANAFETTESRAQSRADGSREGSGSAAPGVLRKAADDGSGGTDASQLKTSLADKIKGLFNTSEPTPEELQRKREKIRDKAMQSEAFDLLKDDRFKKKTWKDASEEQRKQMLRDFSNELARVYGIPAPASIDFESMDDFTYGYYSRYYKKVAINESRLGTDDYRDATHTLIHEMRHAYQWEVVDNPSQFDVTAETVKQWRDNFYDYRSPGETAPDGHTYTYDEYIQQPVEWDAMNFEKEDIRARYTPDYEGSWKDEPSWHFWHY